MNNGISFQALREVDTSRTPVVVIWEMTQACDLACVHCRACAQPLRDPMELTTRDAESLIRQVAFLKPPIFVLSGGDPLKRADLLHLVRFATDLGLRVSLTPSATPLLTPEVIADLKDAGLAQMALSLDGSTPGRHDSFRGVTGSFNKTMEAAHAAVRHGLPLQINTTISRRTVDDLEKIAHLVERLGVMQWSVFFLVPTGRGAADDMLDAKETEEVFRKLYAISLRVPFRIKSTEAQHFRRYTLQQQRARGQKPTPSRILRINDAKGFVFISHRGEVFPSGFLPVSAGNIRHQTLTEIYRESSLFQELRDTNRLEGKCGVCEFRVVCGGSRARAYAMTGNLFAEEPTCVYVPPEYQPAAK